MDKLNHPSIAGTMPRRVTRERFGIHMMSGRMKRQVSYVAMTLYWVVLVAVATSAIGCGLTANHPASARSHECSSSDQVYAGDKLLEQSKAPTHFRVMSSRYVEIVQAARGSNCTHSAAVAFNGHNYLQAGMSDDPGIAELIPMIATWTETSLAGAFDFTELSVICLGILIGYAAFWRLFPDRQARWLGIVIFLCLGLVEARVADVYIYQASPLIAGIPWVLHFALSRRLFALDLSAAMLAFCCSWCSLVRIGTTTICMAFLVTLFICYHPSAKTFWRLLLVCLACVPALTLEHNLINHRNEILAGYGDNAGSVDTHPVWHSIYVGLGFVPNSEVSKFSDSVAMDKARSLDPTVAYTSARYESILRSEVLRIAKEKPSVLVENLAAKAVTVGVLAMVLLFPSRRSLFRAGHVLWLDAAFAAAIVVSSMNAVLVAPKPAYLLTFFCLTLLYSSIVFCSSRTARSRSRLSSIQRDISPAEG